MIPLVKPFLPPSNALMPALQNIIYSGYIAEGEAVKDFEQNFSNYIKNDHVLSVNSGTAALHIALLLAGVKPGDDVISTVLTAEPTNMAIKMCGANIIWADIDYHTGTISADSIRRLITDKTSAIMVVHYAGIVADMQEINNVSKEFNIPVIEDAAHALGAKYDGNYVGTISDFTAFSFQAIKHMTTIDGGMLAVKSASDYNKGRLMRWFGIDKNVPRMENNIDSVGYKYHMNNVTATIGITQMEYIRDVISIHIENGKFYDRELIGTNGIELLNYYEKSEPSYWLYTLKVEDKNGFIKLLNENNIAASELHLRNDRHKLFGKADELPMTDKFYEKMVHIPCGWWVTQEDRNNIVNVIKRGW